MSCAISLRGKRLSGQPFHGTILAVLNGDDLLDDWDGPSTEEIERVVIKALRRYGYAPADPLDDGAPGAVLSTGEAEDLITNTMRRCGLLASPPPIGRPHPLASAGPKLKSLRTRSGWTTEELAERTATPFDLLTAFENGDSAAAGELTTFDLERLASACCGTLADLLGPEHPWVKAARRRDCRVGRSIAIDPHG